MIAWFVFGGLLLYAAWAVISASVVLRFHRDDPAQKIVLIPSRQDPTNPFVTSVRGLRVRVRARRRKWLLMAAVALAAMAGLFSSWGQASLALVVALVLARLLNATATNASEQAGGEPPPSVREVAR